MRHAEMSTAAPAVAAATAPMTAAAAAAPMTAAATAPVAAASTTAATAAALGKRDVGSAKWHAKREPECAETCGKA